ncbi:MAG: tetratricopeptide repeat protein [Spirochaetaceae bacterium]
MKKIILILLSLIILGCGTTKNTVLEDETMSPKGSDEFIVAMETWDNPEEKIELLNKVVIADPDNPLAYYYLALVLKDSNKLKKSIDALDSAIEIDPNFVSAYILRGETKLWDLDDKTGVDDFKQAYEINPSSIKAALAYGSNNEWQTEELKETFYTDLVNKFPDNAEVLKELALTFHQQGSQEKAIELINKAIGLEPDDSYLYLKKAYFHADYAEYMLAEETMVQAVNMSPDNPHYKVFLASILRHMGRLDEALIYLKESGNGDWIDDGMFPELIRVESRLGIFDSLEFYSQNLYDDPWSDFFRGVIALRTGDTDSALTYIKEARNMEEWNTEFTLSLSYLYLKIGNIDMSNEVLRKIEVNELINSTWYTTYELYYDLIKDIESGVISQDDVPEVLLIEK